MDREREEAVLHITAEYVAEMQAGNAPRLSDYLARYPQYADEIAEFVTYYHAVEVDLPGESLVMPPLSERSTVAVERAWERIQEPVEAQFITPSASTNPFTTLLAITNRRHLSLTELAVKSGLSQDIIEQLERRTIATWTLPRELLKRFATILQQPPDVIATCFGLFGQSQMDASGNVTASLTRARMAEARSFYEIEEQPGTVQSFREAMEQSVQLSDDQKAIWRDILSREGL